MATRKPARKTTRRSSPRRRNPARRRKPGSGIGPWQWLILVASFLCMAASVYLTFFMEREPDAGEEPSITEKARRLAEEHPDAEVFNLEENEKKNE